VTKILLITNRLVVGGPSVHLLQLVGFFNNSHQIFLAYGPPEPGEVSMELEFEKFAVELIKIPALKRSLNPFLEVQAAFKIHQIIQRIKPDIVHTHTFKAGLWGRFFARCHKIERIIHTYHGFIFKSYFNALISNLFIRIDRYLATFTDLIILLSESQKHELLNRYKIGIDSQMRIIPLTPNLIPTIDSATDDFRKTWGIGAEKIIIAMVGRLEEIKQPHILLEAFALQKIDLRNKAVLIYVGDGSLKSNLVSLAQKYGLKYSMVADSTAEVLFTSWVRNMAEVYQDIDLLVLTSKNEGTPLAIIEAISMGVPVFATNVGGVKDLLKSTDNGSLFETPQQLQQLIEAFLNTKQKSTMRQRSLSSRLLHQDFSETKFAYSEIYSEDLIKRK
jgi:glycosyltransferase involved in cell wall biosynthesis